MTTAEIKSVLDQLADAGVFFLTFSGGEVFLRRDFLELVAYARRLLFNVKVKTNAAMIREPEARKLRELGIENIQISVYSHRPEVHDAITKLPGSLNRTIKADPLSKIPRSACHNRECTDEVEPSRPHRRSRAG